VGNASLLPTLPADDGVYAAAAWAARKGDGVPKSIVVMEVPESTISKIMKNIKSGTPEGMPISHPDEFILVHKHLIF